MDAAFLLTVGSFLLTVELFDLQLTILASLLTIGAFLLTVLAFFAYSWSFFAYSGKVLLIRALRDCKQRSLTVSEKAPTVSKKASPDFGGLFDVPPKGRGKRGWDTYFFLSAAAFWGFSRGGFPENACIGGAISERNFCEICRRKSPQNTEKKHKTKLCAEVPERPLPKDPFFQLLSFFLSGLVTFWVATLSLS